ncbi:MAG: hypothetical protein LBG13_03435 [Holosporales bacterium]|jgi:hypothetical protein|nr:hypothetical protein [Holosporales bacterium]
MSPSGGGHFEPDSQPGSNGEVVYIERTYDNGNTYKGQSRYGVPDENGILIYPNGNVYQGDFKGGSFEGKGKLTCTSGAIYEGDFKNGLFGGKGRLYVNGEVYNGDFMNDAAEGVGKLVLASGAIYEGDFKNGLFGGKGILKLADGTVICEGNCERYYKDYFKNDKIKGYGRFKKSILVVIRTKHPTDMCTSLISRMCTSLISRMCAKIILYTQCLSKMISLQIT